MPHDQAAIDAILNEVRIEFIESTTDRLTLVDNLISDLMVGSSQSERPLIELLRHVHNIKGQGTTFDFPTVSDVAHRLEDFIETTTELDGPRLRHVQTFVDVMRQIIESRVDPSGDEAARIISSLPISASAVRSSRQTPLDQIRMLLVMPKGAQRKIVGKELASCGFHVITADTPVDAIRLAISRTPEVIIASRVMEDISGPELALVLNVVAATRKCHVVIATSSDDTTRNSDLGELPEHAAVVHKGTNFIADLTGLLDRWGYFD